MQAVEERRRCQAQLALLEEDPARALREQQESSLQFLFFQSAGNSLGLSVLAINQPDRLLAHLDASVRSDKDLPTLYYLVEEARSWQSLLIARVYGRMFSRSVISTREASDLCEQMLAAIRSLPNSSLRQEYEVIYSAVAGWLQGNAQLIPALPQLPPDAPQSVLHNSHELAKEVLELGLGTQDTFLSGLNTLLADPRGWWETSLFELRYNLLLQGSGHYQVYFFPAVRLALIAAASRHNIKDPAARLMLERWETYEGLRDHLNVLDHQNLEEYPPEWVESALSAFYARAESAPQDERVHFWLGSLLLGLGRFGDAQESLQQSLSLPTSRGDIRAAALYNLACVYARLNDEAECRRMLEERARIEPLDRDWLARDPDLESVRDTAWFQSLLATEGTGESAVDGGGSEEH